MSSAVTFSQYVAQETALPHPYMLRPGSGGSYFIYLPKGCLTVDGEVIDVDQYFTGVATNESVMKSPWYQYSTSVSSGGQAQPQSMKVKFLWNKEENKYGIQNVEFFSGEGGDDGSGDEGDEGDEKEKTVTVPISRPDGAGRPSPVVSSAVHLSVFDIGARVELKDKSGESDKTIKIDVDALESCDEDEMSIKTIKWPKKATEEDPETTGEAHILACKDIDLSGVAGANYSADTGIKISESSDDGTEGSSSKDSSLKIKNTGVVSIAFGNNTQQANGTLKIVGAEGSGLEVTGTDFSGAGEDGQAVDYTNGTCNFDLKGRDENDEFAVKTVTLPKKDGAEAGAANTVRVLATDDIDLSDLGGGVTIEKEAGDDNIIEVTAPSGESKAYKLKVPKGVTSITGGNGVTVDTNTGDVTISVEDKDTTYTAGSGISISSNNEIENTGVLSLGASSGSSLVGDVKITANASSGLTTAVSGGDNIEIDIKGRTGSLEMRSVTLGGNTVAVAHVFGDTDFEITQKTIKAGTGITVDDDGETVTISATGTTTTGFTGTRTVLADVDFSSPYLRKRLCTETWENGVLKTSTTGNWTNYHTSVEETT